MARKWIQSLDLEVDADGKPAFETALAALREAAGGAQRASSGDTPTGTDGDTPVTLLDAHADRVFHTVRIVNEGAAAGFYSLDGGASWDRLPAECVVEDPRVRIENTAIQVKRTAGGADLSGVYASAW